MQEETKLKVIFNGKIVYLTAPLQILQSVSFILKEYSSLVNTYSNMYLPISKIKYSLISDLKNNLIDYFNLTNLDLEVSDRFNVDSLDIKQNPYGRDDYLYLTILIENVKLGKWSLEVPPLNDNSLKKIQSDENLSLLV